MIRSAAMAIACKPDEQNRLIVMAGTSAGRPARWLAMRATFIPASPSGMAQPRMTSSMSLGSSPGTRRIASLHGDGRKIVRPRRAQRALERFSYRRADGTYDDGVSHLIGSILVKSGW